MAPEEIMPCEYGIIAYDNNGNSVSDSCGSTSWQVHKDNVPVTKDVDIVKYGRRLNILYETYLRCDLI